MKKIILATLIAGFVLRQTAVCQTETTDTSSATNAAAASVAPDVTTDSNVVNSTTAEVVAESNAPAANAESNQPAASAAMTNATETMVASPEQPASVAMTNAPAEIPTSPEPAASASMTNAPTATAASPEPAASASMTNAPTATAASPEPAASASMTNATAETGATNMESTNAPGEQPVDEAGANTPAAELPIQFQDVPITTAIESLARLAGMNYLLDPKIGYGQPDEHGAIKPEPILSLRWENVTAQQALVALLDNYGLQLVGDPKTKIYKITMKDPTAPPQLVTRVIQLKYAATTNMVSAVQSTLSDKRSRVIADIRTSQMVVSATEREQEDVDTMINQLDRPTRQVLIETRLVELSSNPSTKKGIDWTGTLGAQNLAAGNYSTFLYPPTPQQTTTGPGGLPVTTPAQPGLASGLVGQAPAIIGTTQNGFQNPWYLNADGLKAVLSFLNSSSDAQVISTPRVVTLDNETATISVTRAFPIINVTAGTANTTGGSSLTYSNLGTILEVTPHISANDYIWLKVNPSVSSFFGKDSETINGAVTTADIFDLRSITTQVLIPNSNTLVMGGLVSDNPTVGYTKVPILGDIPILGYAFRSENKTTTKGNLLIFITPTIVRDSDFHPVKTEFLNSQPRSIRNQINGHSWWDSANPRANWADPVHEKIDGSPNPE